MLLRIVLEDIVSDSEAPLLAIGLEVMAIRSNNCAACRSRYAFLLPLSNPLDILACKYEDQVSDN